MEPYDIKGEIKRYFSNHLISMGFKKKELDKVKKKMLNVLEKRKNEIQGYGKLKMAEDIQSRQAIDVRLMLRSLTTKYEKTSEGARVGFGVKRAAYESKNPTTPDYVADKAPQEAAPSFSNDGLGNTIDAAIAVIWGLGPHRQRGPRNFPRVAINEVIKKYFGDPKKAKSKS